MNRQASRPPAALERKPPRQPDNSRRKKSPRIPLDEVHFQDQPKVRLSARVLIRQIRLAGEKHSHGSPPHEGKQPTNPATSKHGLILTLLHDSHGLYQ